MHTRESDKTNRTHLSRDIALAVSGIVLVAVAAIAIFVTNQPANVGIPITGNDLARRYENNPELLFAQRWMESQALNKPVVKYGNAMEMQYAQPWILAANKPVVEYGNDMELLYAQPWLDAQAQAQSKSVIAYGNNMEMQYAQPWLDKMSGIPVTGGNPAVTRVFATAEIPLNCNFSIEMLYACKYGFGLP